MPTRAARAAVAPAKAGDTFAVWEAAGHKVEIYGFGEALEPACRSELPRAKAEVTRIGEALSELRTRFAGRDLAAVWLLSDGIDTIFDNFNFKPYWVEPYLAGVRAYIAAGGAPPTNNGRNDHPEQERQSADLRPSGSWCRARTAG